MSSRFKSLQTAGQDIVTGVVAIKQLESGNFIRIPVRLARRCGIGVGSKLVVVWSNGLFKIRAPQRRKIYPLHFLLRGYRPVEGGDAANLFGTPKGRELI